jgi:hypothetical protein
MSNILKALLANSSNSGCGCGPTCRCGEACRCNAAQRCDAACTCGK